MNPEISVSDILAQRREQNRIEQNQRIDEVYKNIPQIIAIDDAIKILGFDIMSMGIQGKNTSVKENELKKLRAEKKNLLIQHGYEPDYMEIRYHHDPCKDTGFIGTEVCSCRKQLIIDEKYNQSNISNLLTYQNFDNFNYNLYSDNPYMDYGISPREIIEKTVSNIKRYINNFSNESKNIYIFGEVGRGKTFLLNSIAKELLDRNFSVLYMTSSNLFKFLNDYNWAFEERREMHQEQYDFILESDLLIIDDLGSEPPSKYTPSNLFEVVNNRMISGKPIIFSTNFDEDYLEETYGPRIFSRIMGNSEVYEIIGEDLRLKD